mgnify:CR=1 FL=1
MSLLWEVECFEWDDGNSEKNLHRATNEECEEVFQDPQKRLVEDADHSLKEESRYILLGRTQEGKQLFIVFTVRDKKIRIISAREMHQKELEKFYGQE